MGCVLHACCTAAVEGVESLTRAVARQSRALGVGGGVGEGDERVLHSRPRAPLPTLRADARVYRCRARSLDAFSSVLSHSHRPSRSSKVENGRQICISLSALQRSKTQNTKGQTSDHGTVRLYPVDGGIAMSYVYVYQNQCLTNNINCKKLTMSTNYKCVRLILTYG